MKGLNDRLRILSEMDLLEHKKVVGLRTAERPEGGHAPASHDNKFPGMEVKAMGGKPSKGTKKDKRLKTNKKGSK